mmetsp:Transcript_92152/g.256756  ORF Transcript_92152/g.256756 Transcript_92152/m.256756 type:complete len:201 (+) Transcript_92152:577-1179(+)
MYRRNPEPTPQVLSGVLARLRAAPAAALASRKSGSSLAVAVTPLPAGCQPRRQNWWCPDPKCQDAGGCCCHYGGGWCGGGLQCHEGWQPHHGCCRGCFCCCPHCGKNLPSGGCQSCNGRPGQDAGGCCCVNGCAIGSCCCCCCCCSSLCARTVTQPRLSAAHRRDPPHHRAATSSRALRWRFCSPALVPSVPVLAAGRRP